MADQQNTGRNEPRLDHVQRGQAITAEAWNKIVDRLNTPLDVSIKRTRRVKSSDGAAGTPKTANVVTALVVQNGNLVWVTDTISYLEPQ